MTADTSIAGPAVNAAGSEVERSIGYRFRDPALLATALTHRSAGRPHNERLEFLGDSLLGLIVAEALFRRFPRADEGQLTRSRATLVRRETLASVARDLDLGESLHLGEGERKSGGWRRDSTLANALEAIVGAVYLDGGLERCREVVLDMLGDRLMETSPEGPAKDAKTRLQEYLQARGLPPPSYDTVAVEGEPHAQQFTVSCHAPDIDLPPVLARGSSRRRAEQAAAARLLEQLGEGGSET
ncbi:MAG: ribonuclease III [Gammaproteobacteria bacterium]|nr:ribonuclease III [Gammaproteobacteria bacterium]